MPTHHGRDGRFKSNYKEYHYWISAKHDHTHIRQKCMFPKYIDRYQQIRKHHIEPTGFSWTDGRLTLGRNDYCGVHLRCNGTEMVGAQDPSMGGSTLGRNFLVRINRMPSHVSRIIQIKVTVMMISPLRYLIVLHRSPRFWYQTSINCTC